MLKLSKVIIVLWNLVFVLLCSQICYGATITYTYDNLNRLTKVVYGDGTTEQFTYDAAGNRLTHVITEPDTWPPTGDVAINNGNQYTSSSTVTLNLSASDSGSGVSQMRFSNDGTTWSDWEPYATSKTWALAPGSGSKTVYVQFKDNAGNISTSYTGAVVLDIDPPTGSIVINGGAAHTANPNVTLTLSATDTGSGVSQMRFSNDGTSWSGWEPYATSKPWTLASGNGIKTVYVRYQDGAGNPSGSFSDTILLTGFIMDFDGDGKADILWRHAGTGEAALWLMSGETISSSAYLPTISDMNWQIMGIGDFDGDGKADILWRHAATGEAALWLMSGETISSSAYLPTISDMNWQIMGIGDFDGDGKADILWRHAGTGEAALWLMSGETISSSAYLPTISDMNWQIM